MAGNTVARAEIEIGAKNKTQAGVASAKSGIGALTSAVKSYGAEMAAVYLVVRQAIKVVTDLTQTYIGEETALLKITSALRATGNTVGYTTDEMVSMASTLRNLTGIEKTAIIDAEGLMTTFTQVGHDVFPAAIEAAADMSVMFGQDLKQSVIQLGTALNDPIAGVGRLRRIGVSFTAEQKESIKTFMDQNDIMSAQRVILDELNREFGGVARAQGDLLGPTQHLKDAFVELKAEIGGMILQGENTLAPMITRQIELTTSWIHEKLELKKIYKELGETAVQSLETMTQAEIEATLKILMLDRQKLENRVAMIDATDGLSLAEKKLLTTLGETINKIKELSTQLAMEINLTDEETESLGRALDGRKKEVKVIADQTEAIRDLVYSTAMYNNSLDMSIRAIEECQAALNGFRAGIEDVVYADETFNNSLDMSDRALQTFAVKSEDAKKKTSEYDGALTILARSINTANEELNTMLDIFAQMASGNIIQAAINIVVELANTLINAFRAEEQEVTIAQEAYLEYIQTLKRYPYDELSEQLYELADAWYEVRTQMSQTVESGLVSAIKEYAESDMSKEALVDLRNAIKDTIKDAVLTAFVESMVTSMMIQGGLQDLIDQIAEMALTGGDVSGYINELRQALPALVSTAEAIASEVAGIISFQHGGRFVTSGPTPIIVGDNPSGRELVTVTPLGGGAAAQGVTMKVEGNGALYEAITQGIRDGYIIIEQDRIVGS